MANKFQKHVKNVTEELLSQECKVDPLLKINYYVSIKDKNAMMLISGDIET